MILEYSAKTDTGIKRDHNEDSYGLFPEEGLFLACDGMGGHAAGDYASKKVVETMSSINKEYSQKLYNEVEDMYGEVPESGRRVAVQIMLANRRLFRLAVMYPKLRGMGTTLTAVKFDKGFANVLNVGDSRTYLFRNSALKQLTVDHSWVEEMLQDGEIEEQELDSFREKNVITRAMGTNPGVKVDYKGVRTRKDDVFLLCSDGLCGEVSDEQIEAIVRRGAGDLERISEDLVVAAKRAGGSDNITVVLVKVKEEEPLLEAINPNKIITVEEKDGVLDTIDEYIDSYIPPENTRVPEGVERERRKLYQSPIFNTLVIAAIFLIVSFVITRTPPGDFEEATGERLAAKGDILIRTDPAGAEVTVQRLDNGYQEKKNSPADFLAIEEGNYRVTVAKDGYERETINIFLRKGIQESRRVELTPRRQIFITLGSNPGFDSTEKIYIDNEPYIYYGRPLTVRRVGFTGKRINVAEEGKHMIRIADKQKEIGTDSMDEVIEVKIEGGEIVIEDKAETP